jgi:hypothetical protein
MEFSVLMKFALSRSGNAVRKRVAVGTREGELRRPRSGRLESDPLMNIAWRHHRRTEDPGFPWILSFHTIKNDDVFSIDGQIGTVLPQQHNHAIYLARLVGQFPGTSI